MDDTRPPNDITFWILDRQVQVKYILSQSTNGKPPNVFLKQREMSSSNIEQILLFNQAMFVLHFPSITHFSNVRKL